MSLSFGVGIIHYKDSIAATSLILSTRRWSRPPTHIFVADNSSDFKFNANAFEQKVRVLDMQGNKGYGVAANALMTAARAAGLKHLLLLTQDALLRSDTAELLQNHLMLDDSVALAAPYLMFSSRPETVFSAGGLLTERGRTLHPQQGLDRSAVNHHLTRNVDWVDGACTMVSLPAAGEVGGFDPAFFLYVEEVDFQFRLRRDGYKVIVVGMSEANQEPGNYSLYYKYRNLIYFTSKYRGSLGQWPWQIALFKDGCKAILRRKPAEIVWALLGVQHAHSGRMGPKPSNLLRGFDATR